MFSCDEVCKKGVVDELHLCLFVLRFVRKGLLMNSTYDICKNVDVNVSIVGGNVLPNITFCKIFLCSNYPRSIMLQYN